MFVSNVGDFSTTAMPALEMTTCTFGWRRDEGVPPYRNGKRHSKRVLTRGVIPAGGRESPLPKRKTTFQTSTCSRRYTCGRTRIAPTTLYQSLYLPLLNVISTEARVKPERSGEIPRGRSIKFVYATSVFPSGRLPRRALRSSQRQGGTGVRLVY